MSIVLWEDSKRANAQKIIDWLLSQRQESGWTEDWLNMIAFVELVASASHSDLDKGTVMRVLNEMIKEGKRDASDFERIFEKHHRERALKLQRDTSVWQFYIPFDIALSGDFPRPARIRALGKDFAFLRPPAVGHRLGKEDSRVLRSTHHIMAGTGLFVEKIPQVFLHVTGQAFSWQLAWQDIAPAFDALRGVLELSFGYGGWRISSDGTSPRRKIQHPLWMLAKKPDAALEWIRFITDDNKSQGPFSFTESSFEFEFTKERFAAVKGNAKFLRQEVEPNSTVSLIADCLRLYSQAMDARFRHECFLGLWQLAEAITRAKTFGGDTDKVAARIAWHGKKTGLVGSGYAETLNKFAVKRNDIAHRGIHEVEDEDVNILKFACEVALMWLIREHEALPTTAHLDQFYRLRELQEANPTGFEAAKRCIKYIDHSSTR